MNDFYNYLCVDHIKKIIIIIIATDDTMICIIFVESDVSTLTLIVNIKHAPNIINKIATGT